MFSNTNVSWTTSAVSLRADDFYIEVGGQRYVDRTATLQIASDPGHPHYRDLELIWQEHGVEMRLFMYFAADADHWWVDEIRTYNGHDPGEWLYYKGVFFSSNTGEPFSGNVDLRSEPRDNTTGTIHFRNLRLHAF